MNEDTIKAYENGTLPLPKTQLAWPLYGAGLDQLGKHGKPVPRDVPIFGDDELLMRIDACSLCYTDVKQIRLGGNHPRLLERDLASDPVVPGHEVSLTLVAVGKNLQSEYHIGQRFTLQPDIWVNGKSLPFCFGLDGGYRQYTKVGKEILHGDAGNHLMPIPDSLSYAGSALVEPWACVEATYRMDYRNHVRHEGTMWIVGAPSSKADYTLAGLFDQQTKPESVILSDVSEPLHDECTKLCAALHIHCQDMPVERVVEKDISFDDVILLDDAVRLLNEVNGKLRKGAVVALANRYAEPTLEADVDLGRLHYDAILYTGTDSRELQHAYSRTETRVELKPHGRLWILGAGGPMGRMHIQRALEAPDGPSMIIATELSQERLEALRQDFMPLADKQGRTLLLECPSDEARNAAFAEEIRALGGADDIRMMAVTPRLVQQVLSMCAPGAVIDVFAGLKRGTSAPVPAEKLCGKDQIRFIGHSGLTHADEDAVLTKTDAGTLNLQQSVAAVGGMLQIPEAIKAMEKGTYPGKIVIYPHVLDFPLTGLNEMQVKAPAVHAALEHGRFWTREAERIFLNQNLTT